MSKTLTRTVCVKLDVGESSPALAATQVAFNAAATWIAQVCWDEHITNTNEAHHRVYGGTRSRFGLGAQLACCARAKAVEACGAVRTLQATEQIAYAVRVREAQAEGKEPDPLRVFSCPTFGPRGSVRYDVRTYRLMAMDKVSLNTLSGRVICRLLPGHHQHTLLVDPAWKIGGADLVWRDGVYFLHITQTCPAPTTDGSGGVLGVDLGMVRLATDSDGDHFSGGKVKGMRHYFNRRRRGLQQRGTKSARRRLKQIKRRESRFQRDTNHVISKRLVAKAASATKALAVEDLTGINERATVQVAQRSWRMGWAFYQLKVFVLYKAAAAGVPVFQVEPRNTSRTCSICRHCEKANRHSQSSFLCRSCGFVCNADHNAARNIAYLASVNTPIVSDTIHRPVRLSSVRVVAPGTSPDALALGS
jgi:IS605 OrfB family transposase